MLKYYTDQDPNSQCRCPGGSFRSRSARAANGHRPGAGLLRFLPHSARLHCIALTLVLLPAGTGMAQSLGIVLSPAAPCLAEATAGTETEEQNNTQSPREAKREMPVRIFRFGSVVHLAAASGNTVEVMNPGCHMNRKFLREFKPDAGVILRPESHHCIGTETYLDFPIILLEKSYLAFHQSDIGPSPSPRGLIVEFGNFASTEDGLVFHPELAGYFDPVGDWKKQKMTMQPWSLNYDTDVQGPYFRSDRSRFSRMEARAICSGKRNVEGEGPAEAYYVVDRPDPAEFQRAVESIWAEHGFWEKESYEHWILNNCNGIMHCEVP